MNLLIAKFEFKASVFSLRLLTVHQKVYRCSDQMAYFESARIGHIDRRWGSPCRWTLGRQPRIVDENTAKTTADKEVSASR